MKKLTKISTKILLRIDELKDIHKQITDRHERNRLLFERNQDSISARDQVISDENSSYISEIWGRLNELEHLLLDLEKIQ